MTTTSQNVCRVCASRTGVYKLPSEHADLETEALCGEEVEVLDRCGDWVQVVTKRDEYPGYILREHLHDGPAPTRWISDKIVPVYSRPDFKWPIHDRHLYMNSLVCEIGQQDTPEGRMLEIEGFGWIFSDQSRPIDFKAPDFVAECLKFLGTNYEWGFRSVLIDCSALLQAGCIAAGIPCPRNVGQQAASLGEEVEFASDFSNLVRGDMVFWTEAKGRHVAIMLDPANALHATIAKPYRTTLIQPLKEVIADQARNGNGGVTTVRRFPEYRFR